MKKKINHLLESYRKEILSFAMIFGIRTVNYLLETLLPQLLCYISILTYASSIHTVLLTANTILIISYFNTMCQTFSFEFMKAVTNTVNAMVSVNRIEVGLIFDRIGIWSDQIIKKLFDRNDQNEILTQTCCIRASHFFLNFHQKSQNSYYLLYEYGLATRILRKSMFWKKNKGFLLLNESF